MGPIDYTSLQTQVDPNAFAQAFANFAGIRQALDQRVAAQQLRQQQQVFNDELRALGAKPSSSQYAALMARYPQFSEKLKGGFDALQKEEREGRLNQYTQVYAALQSGSPQVAQDILRKSAEAKRNSGMEEDAAGDEQFADLIGKDPTQALNTGGIYLASALGPEKFAETFAKLGEERRAQEKAPGELAKTNAEAAKTEAEANRAATLAKYADQSERLDLAKKSEDIRASRENVKLRTLEAQLATETNDLRRQDLQLKVDSARQELNTKAAERVAEADTALAGLGDAADLVGGLLKDEDRLRTAIGTLGFRASVPGTEARTVRGEIERLQSSLTAANLDKLKGAMSDNDLKFLKSISSNLDRFQNEASFIKELKRVQTVITQSQDRVRKKYGASTTPATASEPTTASIPEDVTVSNW